MYKTCSRCGQIHDTRYKCTINKPIVDYSRYSTNEERELRSGAEWKAKSIEIRTAARYLCEVCFDRGIYNYRDLEVHHITKLRDNVAGLLDDNNLICLCAKHHRQADNGQLDADYLRRLAKGRNDKQYVRT